MTRITHVTYSGLQSPIAFCDAEELEQLIGEIIPSWPTAPSETGDCPAAFASLSPAGVGKWRVALQSDQQRERVWNNVDAICDLISEMAWQQVQAAPDMLCLHAAAVAFGDRLVVFPNARRAGKSTLSIALAKLGLPLFTDDFLPVEIAAEDGRLIGVANGIAPRLRQPVPDTFSDDFKSWVARNPGPENDQYKYLTGLPLASGQTRLPLGAVVVLDRQEQPTISRLDPAAPAEVVKALITQNFSRDQHAGRILKSVEAVTQALPLFRLVYSCAEEAAACLADHPLLQDLPQAQMAQRPSDEPAQTYHRTPQPAENFDPEAIYRHARDLVETAVDGTQFLVDGQGNAIHQLNTGSMAIWRILAQPARLNEVVEVLSAAFPHTDLRQIQTDATQCLHQLAAARLIETDKTQETPGGETD